MPRHHTMRGNDMAEILSRPKLRRRLMVVGGAGVVAAAAAGGFLAFGSHSPVHAFTVAAPKPAAPAADPAEGTTTGPDTDTLQQGDQGAADTATTGTSGTAPAGTSATAPSAGTSVT